MTPLEKSRTLRPFVLLFVFSFFISCASYVDQQKKLLEAYKSRNYTQALEELEKSSLKGSSKNRLLYILEKASILRKQGEKEKAQKLFLEADQVIDELYTKSILEGAASLIYNESAISYSGELFERVHLHTLLAFMFIEERDLGKARVEAKKINSRLHEFTQDFGDKNNTYRKDAFALYLSGTIFEALGEYDDAIIDYKNALEVFETKLFESFYYGNIKEQVANALYHLSLKRGREDLAGKILSRYPSIRQKKQEKEGELVVLHEGGLISLKQEKTFLLPVGEQVVRFSYPIIESESPHFGQMGVIFSGDHFVSAENGAYLSPIAHQTLEEKRFRLIAKGLARVLIKSQINRAVSENLGLFAGLVSNVVTAATETADTRSWMFLPDGFFVTRVSLPEGEHEIITVNDGMRSPVQKIKIQAGKLTLIKTAP